MWRDDFAVAYDALRAASLESGGEADTEVLARLSRGTCVRRARGMPDDASAWREESVAVRVVLPEGGEAIASAASWDDAEDVARRAVALASRNAADAPPDDVRADGREPRARAAGRAPSRVEHVAREPQDEGELREALTIVEAEALAQDERIVALDAGLARSAVVDSYLAATPGLALHQRHASAAAHAAVIARDGMSVAVRGDAWAGSRFLRDDARRVGRRLGTAGLVHLVGSGAAPPSPQALLLSAGALADLTLPLAGALLGLVTGAPREASGLPEALTLREDAADDLSARALPVDGAGRLLSCADVVRDGAWRAPGARALPSIRAASGDAPRPGFLRLTWSWRDGCDDDALLARLGTGLWIESAHAVATEPTTLSWRGVVAGFWVEDGRRRHAVAGVPFATSLIELLRGAVAGGREPETAHASGSVRAVPIVVLTTRG